MKQRGALAPPQTINKVLDCFIRLRRPVCRKRVSTISVHIDGRYKPISRCAARKSGGISGARSASSIASKANGFFDAQSATRLRRYCPVARLVFTPAPRSQSQARIFPVANAPRGILRPRPYLLRRVLPHAAAGRSAQIYFAKQKGTGNELAVSLGG